MDLAPLLALYHGSDCLSEISLPKLLRTTERKLELVNALEEWLKSRPTQPVQYFPHYAPAVSPEFAVAVNVRKECLKSVQFNDSIRTLHS
jgi:hypothetical protein